MESFNVGDEVIVVDSRRHEAEFYDYIDLNGLSELSSFVVAHISGVWVRGDNHKYFMHPSHFVRVPRGKEREEVETSLFQKGLIEFKKRISKCKQ